MNQGRRSVRSRVATLVGVVSMVAGLLGALAATAAPALADTFPTQTVTGTSSFTGVACPNSTTCVAVGRGAPDNGSIDTAVVTTITNGTPGPVAVAAAPVAGFYAVACPSATSCVAVGIETQGEGVVVPITVGPAGTADTFGAAEPILGTYALNAVACPSMMSCVAVGETDVSGNVSQGAVVTLPGPTGTPSSAQDVSGAIGLNGVDCVSATSCVAVGGGSSGELVVPLASGQAGSPQVVSGASSLRAVACVFGTTTCEAVGYSASGGAVVTITNGAAGTLQAVPGTGSLLGVVCHNATSCVAVGQDQNQGTVVALAPGATPGTPQNAGLSYDLESVSCTTATSCTAVGQNNGGVGVVVTADVTVPTATVTGQVTLAGAKGTSTPVNGSPVQACSTDGSFCTSNIYSTDSAGNYSLIVPAGSSYVLTAFSPTGQALTQASTTPVAVTTTGQTGVNITLEPGPGLVSGVKIISSEFGTETSATSVPTVNWGQPFQVDLPADLFPTGETTTVETLVVTGINSVTGQAASVTVYAGGETTISSGPDAGKPAAIGLVVGPSGVDLTVPALAPIHGPVSLLLTSFSVPIPPTGVALAGPNPVIFTNGNPQQPAPIAATDFGVDHTIGTPTITGPDAASFKLTAPAGCTPSATIVQNAQGIPSPNGSCAINVTWTPPALPGASVYQATMNVPVTNNMGQTATLPVPLLACDTRLVSGATCGGNSGGSSGGSSGTVGGGSPIGGLYVDPSGTVQAMTSGGSMAPVSGATVTLSRQDPSTTLFSMVPQGSDIMSPGNRNNPQTTGNDGSFGWDTLAGTYEIGAAKTGCTSATTPPETVPPPVTGLVITLACPPVTLSSTTTSLTATPSPVTTGGSVTFDATVKGANPSGTISLAEGATSLADLTVDPTDGTATFSTASLAPGPHTLIASYSGDAANGPSSGPVTVNVVEPAVIKSPQTLTFTSHPPSPATVGGTYTPAATGGGSTNPVTFSLDGTSTGCTISNAGVVSFTAAGRCVVDANQAGNADYTAAPQVQQTIAVTPAAPPPTATSAAGGARLAATADDNGYWVLNPNGTVSAYGDATNYGSTVSTHLQLNRPPVGIAATPDGKGYWIVAADGGVFSFGDARFLGSEGGSHLNKPVVAMAATPDGAGYWLVASDGGIFTFGDAGFHGSTGSERLNQPVVGMAATVDGGGYWLVASDGGIFTFGDAGFHGSTGSERLNQPVIGMTRTPDGAGYWLVAADGGVFTFGDAHFYGSLGAATITNPAVGLISSPTGGGYTIVNTAGTPAVYGAA